MKKVSIVLFVATLFFACSKNAVTGRKQLKLFPESVLQDQALTEYRSFLSTNKVLSENVNKDAVMVRRVGLRISKCITDYYTAKGLGKELENYKWEFKLVDNKEVNAWCMPGGKVVVYTGLLAVTQNEAALAVVMGHEITHAVAHHGNERISQVAIAEGFEVAGNIFTSAMSCYNPNEAIPFWKRMSQAGGQKPLEFLATHPSDDRRIAELQRLMPEALSYYKPIGSR